MSNDRLWSSLKYDFLSDYSLYQIVHVVLCRCIVLCVRFHVFLAFLSLFYDGEWFLELRDFAKEDVMTDDKDGLALTAKDAFMHDIEVAGNYGELRHEQQASVLVLRWA